MTMDEWDLSGDGSGEEPLLSTTQTVASLHRDAELGLGWGLGLFTGIVLVIGVMYFLLYRSKRRVNYFY